MARDRTLLTEDETSSLIALVPPGEFISLEWGSGGHVYLTGAPGNAWAFHILDVARGKATP